MKSEELKSEAMKSRAASRPKKSYRAPRLVVYGDLSRLTAAKGGTKGDGAGKPRTKL
ncbi:MAG: lasso RiPP family leader peptide-containing protein [Candidatus Rokubacteria bacterium]|nr:lasso RiPP family leader peptide-containing protein [Candidatus Rokubacteria bacterium]